MGKVPWGLTDIPATSLKCKVGLLNGTSGEIGKQQLGWLKYSPNSDLDFFSYFSNNGDNKKSYAVGGLYKLNSLELSGEYITMQNIGNPRLVVLKGEYTVSPQWCVAASFSWFYKNSNNNPAEFREMIVGTKYNIAQGLDWEIEYLIDSGDDSVLIFRIEAKF